MSQTSHVSKSAVQLLSVLEQYDESDKQLEEKFYQGMEGLFDQIRQTTDDLNNVRMGIFRCSSTQSRYEGDRRHCSSTCPTKGKSFSRLWSFRSRKMSENDMKIVKIIRLKWVGFGVRWQSCKSICNQTPKN